MENTMDEKLLQKYIDLLTTRFNELGQENILLKAKLSLASEEVTYLKKVVEEKNSESGEWSQETEETVENVDNKTKKK